MPIRFTEELQELGLEFVTSTQAILAKKRVGKSYTASVQAEELLKANQQIVVIDPTSAWWGLRSSSDGTSAGHSIAVFGGRHGDLPLEPGAGAVLAEAVVTDRFSAVLDLKLMEKGQANRFVGEFLRTLYQMNQDPVHVFCDEADLFAPQRLDANAARTLDAMDDVVRRGGINGIGFTMITQRPAVLSKNILSQVDMITCLRMHHPADLDQVMDWVKVHATKEQAATMLESLPSLATGEAWLWNPEINLFRKVHIRRRHTFDSGATPKPGEQVRAPKVVAEIDLGKLGTAIAATVERVKSTDPKFMAKHIADLESALEGMRKSETALGAIAEALFGADYTAEPDAVVDAVKGLLVHKAGYDEDDLATLNRVGAALREAADELQRLATKGIDQIGPEAKPPIARRDRQDPPGQHRVIGAPLPRIGGGNHYITGATVDAEVERVVRATHGAYPAHHKLLGVFVYLDVPATPVEELALLAGYSAGASTIGNYLSKLREEGLVTSATRGHYAITKEGIKAAKKVELPLGPKERQAYWVRETGAAGNILTTLIEAYPNALTHDQIADKTGYSAGASTIGNYLAKLSKKGLVVKPRRGEYKANDALFRKGKYPS